MDLPTIFRELYPSRHIPVLEIKYSAKFKDYNANVHIRKEFRTVVKLTFSLSRAFEDVDEDIQAGVVQYLLNKVYNTKIQTDKQNYYHSFIKNVGRYALKGESDPYLVELFHELNFEYFDELMEQPTMTFVGENTTTLGKYHYNDDSITISSILQGDRNLLKFVLYHELLHKKHGFKQSGNRSYYHTKEFRADEKLYEDKDVEKKLDKFVRKHKRFKFW